MGYATLSTTEEAAMKPTPHSARERKQIRRDAAIVRALGGSPDSPQLVAERQMRGHFLLPEKLTFDVLAEAADTYDLRGKRDAFSVALLAEATRRYNAHKAMAEALRLAMDYCPAAYFKLQSVGRALVQAGTP
jgi:hypothetical protein